MHEVLTITHTCPICGRDGLTILLERNINAMYTENCSNDDYGHYSRGENHYFVRKLVNIREKLTSIVHVEHLYQ